MDAVYPGLSESEWRRHDTIVDTSPLAHPDGDPIKSWGTNNIEVWRQVAVETMSGPIQPTEVTRDAAGRVVRRTRLVEELTDIPVGWDGVRREDVPKAEQYAFRTAQLHKDDGPTRQEVAYSGDVLTIRAFGYSRPLRLDEMLQLGAGDTQCLGVSYDPYALPSDYTGPRVNTPPGAVVVRVRSARAADEAGGAGDDGVAPRVKRVPIQLDSSTGALVVRQPPSVLGSVLSGLWGAASALVTRPAAPAPTAASYPRPGDLINGWCDVAAHDCDRVNRVAYATASHLFSQDGQMPSEQRVVCEEGGIYAIYTYGVPGVVTTKDLAVFHGYAGVVSVAYDPRVRSARPQSFAAPSSSGAAPATTMMMAAPPNVSPGALTVRLLNTERYSERQLEYARDTAAASALRPAKRPADAPRATTNGKRPAPGEDD